MSERIGFAKVGGPPANWWECEVFLNGARLEHVIEADANKGYAIVLQSENGRFIMDETGTHVATKEVKGEIEIMENTGEKAPLTFAQKIEKSTQIASAAYDAEKRELTVSFKNGTPALYTYKDVPADVWERMQGAESIGSFFHHEVKKRGFQFDRRALPQA